MAINKSPCRNGVKMARMTPMTTDLQLYSYYRSSCAYRVRIALAYKGLPYTTHPVHLVRNGGEQHKPDYAALNPQEQVPTLVDGDFVLSQSMATMEYLDERYPATPIMPADAQQRAFVRQLSLIMVADIHPLNNLRILQHLSTDLGLSLAQKNDWYAKWIAQGFAATEKLLEASRWRTGAFACGDTPTMADFCLIPQVYNAVRYDVALDDYPLIRAINEHCLSLPYFEAASPENQPDTPEDHRPVFLKARS